MSINVQKVFVYALVVLAVLNALTAVAEFLSGNPIGFFNVVVAAFTLLVAMTLRKA